MPYQFEGTDQLVWQPDTDAQNLPSGLLIVRRSALVRKTEIANVRNQFEVGAILPCNVGAIEDVRIFPQPEERDEGGGFIRINATGYGRWTTEENLNTGTVFGSVQILPNVTEGPFIFPTETYSLVVPKNADVSFLGIGIREITRTNTTTGDETELTILFSVLDISRVNYGEFDEVTYTVAPSPGTLV